MPAVATLLDSAFQTLFRDANQPSLSSLTFPTGTVVAVSPTKAVRVAPTSIEMMSPSPTRNPKEIVNDLFVDRCTDRIGITVIALKVGSAPARESSAPRRGRGQGW
jgi:hypothetical protein